MNEGTLLNGRYQLLEKLGSGGMAEVFRARDPILDRIVAIKVLRQDYSNNPEFQEHFRTEARAAANLSHPNIVTVHDFGFAENLLFIVMEYIPGKDLKQLIRQRGRFTVEAGIPLIIQACAGLGYAHRAGLVHCDVKPHNMLVSPDGRLKVTDFGIARALATMMPDEKADVVWGSPLYFSPEQARGEAPAPAADVYSLGVVMYELLSGTTPFTATTADELARLHVSARPIPIREYIPEIPTALEEIITKVLSKEPAARYRTADQLGRVLQKFGTQPDLPAPEQETAERVPTKEMPPPPPPRLEPAKPRYIPPEPTPPADEPELASAFDEIDWVSVGLGLLAVIAVGGLIPFWMMVYFAYNPPLP
ncbi:protein kinase [Candidatus Villigracilis saccharophilus]|uniref:protein kinase domain-containing protein n=1 Tax=Candidatus Villigracilis saccharophilus TaxID=3140684 RepID=UPI0031362170|nr:serine/threonine protein kinase [Anaerolineales bacterium]